MPLALTKISDDYSVAPQITPDDIAEIAQAGFKTIINNRPDQEGGQDQPTSAAIEAAAHAAGIQYVYIPVVPNAILPAQVAAFKQAYDAAAKPALGFCRTGNRAANMLKLAQSNAASSTPNPNASASASVMQWFKSKCLITKLVRWVKAKTTQDLTPKTP